MSNPEWGGQGIHKNHTNKQHKYDGVTAGRREVGISVMWYGKVDIASSTLDYYVSRTITNSIIQSNIYLCVVASRCTRLLDLTIRFQDCDQRLIDLTMTRRYRGRITSAVRMIGMTRNLV